MTSPKLEEMIESFRTRIKYAVMKDDFKVICALVDKMKLHNISIDDLNLTKSVKEFVVSVVDYESKGLNIIAVDPINPRGR